MSTMSSKASPVAPGPALEAKDTESASPSVSTGMNRAPQALPTPCGMPRSLGPCGGDKANEKLSEHIPFKVDILAQHFGDPDFVPAAPADTSFLREDEDISTLDSKSSQIAAGPASESKDTHAFSSTVSTTINKSAFI